MSDLPRTDIERYALLVGADELDRVLDSLWCSATDLMGSADFRDERGEIPEGVYTDVKARAIKIAREQVIKIRTGALDPTKITTHEDRE